MSQSVTVYEAVLPTISPWLKGLGQATPPRGRQSDRHVTAQHCTGWLLWFKVLEVTMCRVYTVYASLKLMLKFRNLSVAGTGFHNKCISENLNTAKEGLNKALLIKQCCFVFRKLRYVVQSQCSLEETFHFFGRNLPILERSLLVFGRSLPVRAEVVSQTRYESRHQF